MSTKAANKHTRERVNYLIDLMENIANAMVSLQLLIPYDVQFTAEDLQDPRVKLILGGYDEVEST